METCGTFEKCAERVAKEGNPTEAQRIANIIQRNLGWDAFKLLEAAREIRGRID